MLTYPAYEQITEYGHEHRNFFSLGQFCYQLGMILYLLLKVLLRIFSLTLHIGWFKLSIRLSERHILVKYKKASWLQKNKFKSFSYIRGHLWILLCPFKHYLLAIVKYFYALECKVYQWLLFNDVSFVDKCWLFI